MGLVMAFSAMGAAIVVGFIFGLSKSFKYKGSLDKKAGQFILWSLVSGNVTFFIAFALLFLQAKLSAGW